MDVAGAGIGLVIAAPLIIVAAILIKLVSAGPVLFRQQRIGLFGEPFTMYKLRTMYECADPRTHELYIDKLISTDQRMTKRDREDPRIIPFGRLLRKFCIDELPQLFNVLGGDMSLVGPRPCLPFEAGRCQDWQRRRFSVRPGLTGLWQVKGKNRTTFDGMMQMDVRYTVGMSFFSDLTILVSTIGVVLGQVRDE